MPKTKPLKKPNAGFTREDLAAVEIPPLSADALKRLRRAREVAPHLVEQYRRTRGPGKKPAKVPISLRVDQAVVEGYKAKARGEGWQTLMHEALVRGLDRDGRTDRRSMPKRIVRKGKQLADKRKRRA